MPSNLYGPGDNYHPENSHVIPALIRRFHDAKISGKSKVEVWGSGAPLREFLFVDDMAEACVLVMNIDKKDYLRHTQPMLSQINIGFGSDISIQQLAVLVSKVVGYHGLIAFDRTKPDGTPRKLMETTRISNLGWRPRTSLLEGLHVAYNDFLLNDKIF
jgi:GDP-L-fucose synthase